MNMNFKFLISSLIIVALAFSSQAQSKKKKNSSNTQAETINTPTTPQAPIEEQTEVMETIPQKTTSQTTAVRLGHINTQEILAEMQEVLDMQKKIEKLATDFETESNTMRSDYETKMKEYEQNVARWTEPMKRNKEKAIIELGKRIEEFEADAQQSLKTSRDSMLSPILKQVSTAIEDVAKEQGYNYIFDVSVGVLLYFDKSDDIAPFVRKKLNMTAAKPKETAPGISPNK
jgi:outer membrane protein